MLHDIGNIHNTNEHIVLSVGLVHNDVACVHALVDFMANKANPIESEICFVRFYSHACSCSHFHPQDNVFVLWKTWTHEEALFP